MLSFADQWKASDYKLTLTGSWMQDQEDYPGFWDAVYTWIQIESYQEQVVDATLELARSDG